MFPSFDRKWKQLSFIGISLNTFTKSFNTTSIQELSYGIQKIFWFEFRNYSLHYYDQSIVFTIGNHMFRITDVNVLSKVTGDIGRAHR